MKVIGKVESEVELTSQESVRLATYMIAQAYGLPRFNGETFSISDDGEVLVCNYGMTGWHMESPLKNFMEVTEEKRKAVEVIIKLKQTKF